MQILYFHIFHLHTVNYTKGHILGFMSFVIYWQVKKNLNFCLTKSQKSSTSRIIYKLSILNTQNKKIPLDFADDCIQKKLVILRRRKNLQFYVIFPYIWRDNVYADVAPSQKRNISNVFQAICKFYRSSVTRPKLYVKS